MNFAKCLRIPFLQNTSGRLAGTMVYFYGWLWTVTWPLENSDWNLFKVQIKDTRAASLAYLECFYGFITLLPRHQYQKCCKQWKLYLPDSEPQPLDHFFKKVCIEPTDKFLYQVINPFLANVPVLYPQKTLENFWVSGVFKGYKMGTLVRNRLIKTLD